MKWLPFFEHAAAVFEKAGRNSASSHLLIAEKKAQLIFANSSFRDYLMPALMHLPAYEGEADLKVFIWDDASTGTKMIPPPWRPEDYAPKGEVRGWSNERFSLSYQVGSSILAIIDREAKTALYWTADFRKIPYWERGAPLLQLFQFWLGSQTRAALHAAAVGNENGAVLLVGKGGSGKSTTALASLGSRLSFAGDDYCLVSLDEPPRVHSLYNSAKANRTMLRLLRMDFSQTSLPKELLFLYPGWREKIKTSFPLCAIFLPSVTQELEARLAPASAAEALSALAPSSLFQLPGAGSFSFKAMAALAKQLPAFHLFLGTRLSSAPERIQEYLC